jgi:hypothetical protein
MCINNICRTCKHWQTNWVENRESNTEFRVWPQKCAKITETIEIEIDQGSGYDSGGASVQEVCTPAHFGCNHWEHW